MLDIGVGLQDRLEVIDHFARRIDGRPLWQRDIDEQLGAVGAWEELLLHELHAEKCRDEQACRASDDSVLHPQNAIENGMEGTRKARWLVALAFQLLNLVNPRQFRRTRDDRTIVGMTPWLVIQTLTRRDFHGDGPAKRSHHLARRRRTVHPDGHPGMS
jgi:hypothetical protein